MRKCVHWWQILWVTEGNYFIQWMVKYLWSWLTYSGGTMAKNRAGIEALSRDWYFVELEAKPNHASLVPWVCDCGLFARVWWTKRVVKWYWREVWSGRGSASVSRLLGYRVPNWKWLLKDNEFIQTESILSAHGTYLPISKKEWVYAIEISFWNYILCAVYSVHVRYPLVGWYMDIY